MGRVIVRRCDPLEEWDTVDATFSFELPTFLFVVVDPLWIENRLFLTGEF